MPIYLAHLCRFFSQTCEITMRISAPKSLVHESVNFPRIFPRSFTTRTAYQRGRGYQQHLEFTAENRFALNRELSYFRNQSIKSCTQYATDNLYNIDTCVFPKNKYFVLPTDFARFGLDSPRYKSPTARIQRRAAPIVFNKNRFVSRSMKKWDLYGRRVRHWLYAWTSIVRILNTFIEDGTDLN